VLVWSLDTEARGTSIGPLYITGYTSLISNHSTVDTGWQIREKVPGRISIKFGSGGFILKVVEKSEFMFVLVK
jgi:hypothetical protein